MGGALVRFSSEQCTPHTTYYKFHYLSSFHKLCPTGFLVGFLYMARGRRWLLGYLLTTGRNINPMDFRVRDFNLKNRPNGLPE